MAPPFVADRLAVVRPVSRLDQMLLLAIAAIVAAILAIDWAIGRRS